MSLQEKKLNKLLSDESFIKWLKGSTLGEKKEEWDSWYKNDPDHPKIVKQAKKLLNMPFQNKDIEKHEINIELARLRESINNKNNNKSKPDLQPSHHYSEDE